MDAISSALSASGSLLAWIPIVVLTIGFGVVMWRTQSQHFLLRRFWLLVHGSKDIPDADIRAFVDEQTSLQSFRLFSGVKVGTLESAKLLMDWCKHYGIPISKVSECRDCFDPDERKIRVDRLPRKIWRIAQVLWGALLIVLGGISLGAIIYAPGLGQLKATDRWVLVSENQARRTISLPFLTNAVDTGDCRTRMPKQIEGSGFSQQEVDIICDLLQKPEWKHFVGDLKEKLRFSFALLMLVCMTCFYGVYRDVSKWMAAKEIFERTAPRDASSGAQDASDQAAPLPQLALDATGTS